MELLGFILDVVGKVMVAYTAIAVHRHVWKEHKVDEIVFRAMKKEQVMGIAGIILIVIGFCYKFHQKYEHQWKSTIFEKHTHYFCYFWRNRRSHSKS